VCGVLCRAGPAVWPVSRLLTWVKRASLLDGKLSVVAMPVLWCFDPSLRSRLVWRKFEML